MARVATKICFEKKLCYELRIALGDTGRGEESYGELQKLFVVESWQGFNPYDQRISNGQRVWCLPPLLDPLPLWGRGKGEGEEACQPVGNEAGDAGIFFAEHEMIDLRQQMQFNWLFRSLE